MSVHSHEDSTHLDREPVPLPQAGSSPTSRAVAIIKNHALSHRLDIEPRIYEAGFEIVKERQMEFDMETDPDVLYELFGEDADCFSEGPVWVYVLERRRAVEVWKTLMGDPDPLVAREIAPNSLRALFGISAAQNGLMGSSDPEIAEIQIASLFVSSPPFPVTDLPVATPSGSLRSMSESVLAELQRSTNSDNGYAPSRATNPSTVGSHSGRRSMFKARAIPVSHVKPDIVPRTTRAADLRAGVPTQKTPSAPRTPPSKEAIARTFANVPGHKRADTITVASTAPPTIAPRMTRAASLRLGQEPSPKPTRVNASDPAVRSSSVKTTVFDGVPGHKRRETITVASTKAPVMAPRTNRSAALRQQKDAAPPSSFNFRKGGTSFARPLSQASVNVNQACVPSRPASVSSLRPSGLSSTPSRDRSSSHPIPNGTNVNHSPQKPKPRPSSISAPTIVPRTNKSASLRAAKMATATNVKTPRKTIPAFV